MKPKESGNSARGSKLEVLIEDELDDLLYPRIRIFDPEAVLSNVADGRATDGDAGFGLLSACEFEEEGSRPVFPRGVGAEDGPNERRIRIPKVSDRLAYSQQHIMATGQFIECREIL
jgi:hypothetical protein